MKTIGLIGGMSWESTVTYYQIINRVVKEELGGLHSGKIILHSVDFAEIETYQMNGQWDKSGEVLAEAALSLQKAGADYIFLCTNTMHKVAPQIIKAITIPFIHIASATAEVLKERGISSVALLGTSFTMEQDFYKQTLINEGFEVIIPEKEERNLIHSTIYNELVLGIISQSSKQAFITIIENLSKRGAMGVILGCTEIGLLIQQEDTPLPVFDTAIIHAKKAGMIAVK